MRYHENYIWCMDTVVILINDIFSLLGQFLRVISIFGTQMTVILDLVNKSLKNVFYWICWPGKNKFGYQKYISSWSRTKDITQIRFHVWTRRPFWKCHLFNVWTLFERVTRCNIFSDIKIYKIRSRNQICLLWRRKINFSNGPRTNNRLSVKTFRVITKWLIWWNDCYCDGIIWAKLADTATQGPVWDKGHLYSP